MIDLATVRFAVFDFDGVFSDNRVVPLARLVLTRDGGHGCVRELCDAIWRAKREAA